MECLPAGVWSILEFDGGLIKARYHSERSFYDDCTDLLLPRSYYIMRNHIPSIYFSLGRIL